MSVDPSLPLRVDVGIISIRNDEFAAVLERFGSHRNVVRRQRYAIGGLTTNTGKTVTVAMVCSLEQGNGPAQTTANNLIEDFDPAWILLVGIAGGVPSREYTLGDVVVATRVADLRLRAIVNGSPDEQMTGGGPAHRDAASIATHLPALAQELDGWNLPEAIGCSRPRVQLKKVKVYGSTRQRASALECLRHHFGKNHEAAPRVISGPIVSSDSLVKDPKEIERWKQSARQALATEMEAAGVFEAANRSDGVRRVLVLRGLSDIIGVTRDHAWTPYACHVSAAFARALVASGELWQRVETCAERSFAGSAGTSTATARAPEVPPLSQETTSTPQRARGLEAAGEVPDSSAPSEVDPAKPRQIVFNGSPVPSVLTPTDGSHLHFLFDYFNLESPHPPFSIEFEPYFSRVGGIQGLLTTLHDTIKVDTRGTFAIHQTNLSWLGLSADTLVSEIARMEERYRESEIKTVHHSEYISYAAGFEGGFATISFRQSTGGRNIHDGLLNSCRVRLWLEELPLDSTRFLSLGESLSTKPPVVRFREPTDLAHASAHFRVWPTVEVIGWVLEREKPRPWPIDVCGVIIKNPFLGREKDLISALGRDHQWSHELATVRHFPCLLRQHHCQGDSVGKYVLMSLDLNWIGDAWLVTGAVDWTGPLHCVHRDSEKRVAPEASVAPRPPRRRRAQPAL